MAHLVVPLTVKNSIRQLEIGKTVQNIVILRKTVLGRGKEKIESKDKVVHRRREERNARLLLYFKLSFISTNLSVE